MKKYSLIAFFIFACAIIANAQNITGTIKNSDGDLLHFAFVQNQQTKQGTYTDSLGTFTLEAAANASLRIDCVGYKDTTLKIAGKSDLIIVLSTAVNISAAAISRAGDANRQTLQRTFNDAISQTVEKQNATNQFDAAQGAMLPVFNPKEETVGSRYMFKGWVHGYVITVKDSTVQNAGFLFDYDKMGGGLLLTKDKQSAIEINRDLVKSFTLYDDATIAYTFENVPQIDPTHYVQLISPGNKYKIYKTIKTKFVKSNFTTDGLSTTGNNYDEYTNEYAYYILDVKTNQLQKIDLKKKSIKNALSSQADKINKFITDHSSDPIDDSYLSNLGSYINE